MQLSLLIEKQKGAFILLIPLIFLHFTNEEKHNLDRLSYCSLMTVSQKSFKLKFTLTLSVLFVYEMNQPRD